MSEDIVQQLRRIADSDLSWCPQGSPHHCEVAADEIERLRAESDEVRREAAELRNEAADAFWSGRGSCHAEIAKQAAEIERLLDQLRKQTKSFCSHCGQLFDRGENGLQQFQEHIAKCNAHPLHPMAQEIERLREALCECATIATGAYHSFPSDRCAAIECLVDDKLKAAKEAGGDDE